MNPVVDAALQLWNLSGATYKLAAARENAVYHVQDGQRSYALRLHREGYRNDAELQSELQWMAVAAEGGLNVPEPIQAKNGAFLNQVDGVQVDVLTWLSGQPLQDCIDRVSSADRIAIFRAIGRNMARLHDITDAWAPPTGFVRCAWDVEGLLGEQPVWDRFWENPDLTATDADLLLKVREVARETLNPIRSTLDYGLIHADLAPPNVMVDGDRVSFIDFDDGGFGFRLFEVATALFLHQRAPDFSDLKAALLDGYQRVRNLDTEHLELFFVLRSLTYVGWNITRMNENDGMQRNGRYIATAVNLADAYIADNSI